MATSRRPIKKGEALAILSEAIHSDRSAQWWDAFSVAPPNERIGEVEVVHIRGALDHHADGGCDNYEAIMSRVKAAFTVDLEDDAANTLPKAVVLRIDSPGGACSGLNETVFAIRRLAKSTGIPLIAYVDELAASAAYALACACDEIYLPPSAVAGSIGVISAMYDQTEADKQMGIRFVTIKSGARKDDGHPHVAITDAAINAEQRRVDRLAKQFYSIVSQARSSLSIAEIEALQAGVFLGKDVCAKGLADDVMGWEELLSTLNDGDGVKKDLAKVSQAGPHSNTTIGALSATENPNMSATALKALVTRSAAAIAAETDPKKKAALVAAHAAYEAAQAAYKKEKHTIEKTESEESDESAEEEATDKCAESDDGDEPDDDDKDDDDEDKDEKKAAKAILGTSATKAAVQSLATLVRKANAYDQTRKDVEALKAAAVVSQKNALIDEALGGGGKPPRITPAEAILLRGASTSNVKFFLETRKGAVVNSDKTIHRPDPNAKLGDGTGLSAEVKASIEMAVSAAPKGADKSALRKTMIEAHEKRMAAALNGAGSGY